MDFGFPTNIELDSYVLIDFRVRYAFSDHFSALLEVDNVTNSQYMLANGFNTADRSASIALRYALR
jgi:outer membrane cobalamin receptor